MDEQSAHEYEGSIYNVEEDWVFLDNLIEGYGGVDLLAAAQYSIFEKTKRGAALIEVIKEAYSVNADDEQGALDRAMVFTKSFAAGFHLLVEQTESSIGEKEPVLGPVPRAGVLDAIIADTTSLIINATQGDAPSPVEYFNDIAAEGYLEYGGSGSEDYDYPSKNLRDFIDSYADELEKDVLLQPVAKDGFGVAAYVVAKLRQTLEIPQDHSLQKRLPTSRKTDNWLKAVVEDSKTDKREHSAGHHQNNAFADNIREDIEKQGGATDYLFDCQERLDDSGPGVDLAARLSALIHEALDEGNEEAYEIIDEFNDAFAFAYALLLHPQEDRTSGHDNLTTALYAEIELVDVIADAAETLQSQEVITALKQHAEWLMSNNAKSIVGAYEEIFHPDSRHSDVYTIAIGICDKLNEACSNLRDDDKSVRVILPNYDSSGDLDAPSVNSPNDPMDYHLANLIEEVLAGDKAVEFMNKKREAAIEDWGRYAPTNGSLATITRELTRALRYSRYVPSIDEYDQKYRSAKGLAIHALYYGLYIGSRDFDEPGNHEAHAAQIVDTSAALANSLSTFALENPSDELLFDNLEALAANFYLNHESDYTHIEIEKYASEKAATPKMKSMFIAIAGLGAKLFAEAQ